jgi:hypothetical protein
MIDYRFVKCVREYDSADLLELNAIYSTKTNQEENF